MVASGIGFRFRALTGGALKLHTEPQITQVAKFVNDYVDATVREIDAYPPAVPLPNRYRRTGTLYRGWVKTARISPSGIDVKYENRVPYAVYVQGNKQRPYHAAHGWRRVDQHVDRAKFRNGLFAIYRTMRIGL